MQKVKVLLHHLNNLSCHSELTRELQMSHLAQSLFSLALLSITVLMLWEASHISEQHWAALCVFITKIQTHT